MCNLAKAERQGLVDPIRFEASDVNLYRYAGNSPTIVPDPSGLEHYLIGGYQGGDSRFNHANLRYTMSPE